MRNIKEENQDYISIDAGEAVDTVLDTMDRLRTRLEAMAVFRGKKFRAYADSLDSMIESLEEIEAAIREAD